MKKYESTQWEGVKLKSSKVNTSDYTLTGPDSNGNYSITSNSFDVTNVGVPSTIPDNTTYWIMTKYESKTCYFKFIKDLPDYYLINVDYERNISDPINASNVNIIWDVKSYKDGKILQSYIPGIIDDLNFSIEFDFSVINYLYRENEIVGESSTDEGKFSTYINVSYPLMKLYDFTSDLDYEGNGYDCIPNLEQFTYPNKSHSGIEIKWR